MPTLWPQQPSLFETDSLGRWAMARAAGGLIDPREGPPSPLGSPVQRAKLGSFELAADV